MMRVTIERSAFLRALNHVQSVVERRNTIPILSNVLVEAKGAELKLTATDLDIEIVESVVADVATGGSTTVRRTSAAAGRGTGPKWRSTSPSNCAGS